MSIEAHHLLTYANSLRSGDRPEVELRCAASRAYYGALHTVDETFLEFAPPINGRPESSHDRIIGKPLYHAKQRRPGNSDAAVIAQLLPHIKKLRNEADYDISEDFPATKADSVLKRAAEIARLCISVKTQLRNATKLNGQSDSSKLPSNDAQAPQADATSTPVQPPPSASKKPSFKRIR